TRLQSQPLTSQECIVRRYSAHSYCAIILRVFADRRSMLPCLQDGSQSSCACPSSAPSEERPHGFQNPVPQLYFTLLIPASICTTVILCCSPWRFSPDCPELDKTRNGLRPWIHRLFTTCRSQHYFSR